MATRTAVAAPPAPARIRQRRSLTVHISPAITSGLLLAGLVIGAFVTGSAGTLQLAFPAAAMLAGAWIYARQRTVFPGYAWWIWFVSPEVRRLSDFQAGWHEQNLISLTPMLVTALVLPALIRHAPRFRHRSLFPFALMLTGVTYGYIIGVFGMPGFFAATYAAFTWFVPLLLGAWLVLEWRHYPEHREVIGRTFMWAVTLAGIYGIYQFINPPEWDQYWMLKSEMDSIGQPNPFEVRVFSMLNAPGPFAYVIEAALLLLLAFRRQGRLIALVAGLAGLVLSLVRSAWIGMGFALLVYLAYAPWRQPGRRIARALATITAILTLTVIAAEFVPIDPIVETASRRLESLRDISGDVSYQARRGSMHAYVQFITEDFVGEGLGSTGTSIALTRPSSGIRDFDNGVLEIFYALGWPGGVLFLGGLAWIIVPLLRKGEERWDDFSRAARAGGLALVLQAIFGNVFVNVTAAAMWTCFGMLSAARRWASETTEGGQIS